MKQQNSYFKPHYNIKRVTSIIQRYLKILKAIKFHIERNNRDFPGSLVVKTHVSLLGGNGVQFLVREEGSLMLCMAKEIVNIHLKITKKQYLNSTYIKNIN